MSSPRMYLTREVRVHIDGDAGVVVARQTARDLAKHAGFGFTDQVLIATAISELAHNVLLYAGHGEMTLNLTEQNGRVGIVMTAIDEGPGIPDVAQAMQHGYSTSGGLGLGLPGVQRLVDEFEIVSHVGRGTTVTAKKWTR
jgi:serine/threonine-protein kinase RsbT